MPTTLPPILTQAPLVDAKTLRVSRHWLGWFEQSYLRQGGQEAATNTELAGGVLANASHIGQVESDLGSTNTSLAGLEAEVTTLQGVVVDEAGQLDALTTRVDELETTVAGLETRLEALEAWKTALIAALPAVVSVTAVPTLTDAPATADALRDNLTTAWQGTRNTNDSGVATAVNAVRNALAA